jgi:hypothetical protein
MPVGKDVADQQATAAIEALRAGATERLALYLVGSPQAFDHTHTRNLVDAALGPPASSPPSTHTSDGSPRIDVGGGEPR